MLALKEREIVDVAEGLKGRRRSLGSIAASAVTSAVTDFASGLASGAKKAAGKTSEMVAIFFRDTEAHRRALKALAALENTTVDNLMRDALRDLFIYRQALKELAAAEETTVDALKREALRDLFAKRGKRFEAP